MNLTRNADSGRSDRSAESPCVGSTLICAPEVFGDAPNAKVVVGE
jgi:hypothetical protein